MQVILKETLHNLGPAGAIVKVKDGYARNYLFPRDLAAPATTGMQRQLDHIRRLAEKRRLQEIKTAEDLRDRLAQTKINIQARAGENERLFGSVTTAEIAKALAEQGLQIDRRRIVLDQPIRVLGEHTVHVKIDPEVGVDIEVVVEPSPDSRKTLLPIGDKIETTDVTEEAVSSSEKSSGD